MSVSLHSAELGFTLIKEGLPKSAGSSLAPLQPRAEQGFTPSTPPPPSCHPSLPFLTLLSMLLTFIPFKKKTLSSAFPPVCLCSISLHSPSKYRRGEKMHQNTDKLFRFFSPKREEKCLTLQFERKGERKGREGGGVRNKNCIRYKISQSARDMKN